MNATAEQIRHALGHFATGVTVVTSSGAGGQRELCATSPDGGDHEIVVGRLAA